MRDVAIAEVLLALIAAYGVAGMATAVAFAIAGASRVIPGAQVSFAARLLLMPAAVALWPLVLRRWRRPRPAMRRAAPRRPSRAVAGAGARGLLGFTLALALAATYSDPGFRRRER